MTPHISAKKGEIADTVLIFGDPVRCKKSAEKYLKNAKEVSSVRGAYYFTGEYNGKPVTFGTSGMGAGSMGIYSFELFAFYDVKKLIRIGTSGGYVPEIFVGDKVIVSESIADDVTFAVVDAGEPWKILVPDAELQASLKESAQRAGVKLIEGRAHSTLAFYTIKPHEQILEETQAICVEMESYALFVNAKRTGKKAACMVVIVDDRNGSREMTSDERVGACNALIEVALNTL